MVRLALVGLFIAFYLSGITPAQAGPWAKNWQVNGQTRGEHQVLAALEDRMARKEAQREFRRQRMEEKRQIQEERREERQNERIQRPQRQYPERQEGARGDINNQAEQNRRLTPEERRALRREIRRAYEN